MPNIGTDHLTDDSPYRGVMVSTFDLVNYAKDISADDDELFANLLEMIRDYQQTRFDQLKGGQR